VASGVFRQTADALLEKTAVLTVWQGVEALRRVTGVVNGFGTGVNNGWQMQYLLRIQPPLWRSSLRQNFRIFQQQDIEAISATLLAENGITDWTPWLYGDHPAREFCVQYGESDLAFLTRLWSEEGIFFFDQPVPDGAGQTLMLTDNEAGMVSAGEITFNPDRQAGTSRVCISEFRYQAQVRPSSVETKDYTFTSPLWDARFSRDGENLNGQFTQYEIFDYPGRFKDEQHGRDFARYQMEGWRNDAETGTCVSNSPALWPGLRFTLAGHPTELLNREWQVTGCVLSGEQPQAQHGSQGQGTTLSNHLTVIPADRTWRPQPPKKPKVDGPQSAIVTGPAGEEIFCDRYGRVRVRFHWDRYAPDNENSSCWIRVSQAWAGAGFGNLALPRVGQEVIVDFLHGDPDQPLITGRTWHDINLPQGSLPETKTQMSIRSKTYKGSGFNELRFEDATGNEQLYLHAQKNMDTEVLNNRTTDVKVDHTETIGNSQQITVGLGQTVTVGKKNAGGHDQTVTVAHDQTLTVKHDRTLTVSNDHFTRTGHDESLYVARDRNVTVEGKQSHSTTGDHLSLVKGSLSLTVNGDLAQNVSGALGVSVQGDIVLSSSRQITLQSGSSFIVIHPGGVDITGPVIRLNSGGSPGVAVQPVQPVGLKAMEEESENSSQEDGSGTGDSGDNNDQEQQDEDESPESESQFFFS
ncbi:type VI secretion system Vgr family protein, partial [Trabulsiella odontotermitis]|uniref:type VI secretion system Vgr family protein n=1 Tax=Trabulsiella odontotermitis TaxID=379893 RepID=UPI000675C840